MSCWVVPEVAAEFFGLSVPEVERRMLAGAWPMKMEHGFAIIDIDAGGPRLETRPKYTSAARADETPHPEENPFEIVVPDPLAGAIPESALPRTPTGAVAVDEIEFDYHSARIATARLRKPPASH